MNLLSIQSHVACGHVGNTAAVFPLQRLGHEVWAINTVQFSNHPGRGCARGRVFDAMLIDETIGGLADLGVLATCDGVISGYAGTRENAAAALRGVGAVKRARPDAKYCCDPVLGDHGTLYVPRDLADFLASDAVAAADVLTPNLFELEFLTGGSVGTRGELAAALAAVHQRGPATVLVTSANLDATPAGCIDCIVSGPEGRFRARTPRLKTGVHGAGDMLAALFFAHWLTTGSAAAALGHAVSAVYGVLRATAAAGAPELLLVAAQAEIVAPSHVIVPEPF